MGPFELAAGAEQRGACRGVELTRARVTGAVLDGRRQVIDGDAAGPHGGGIGLDADRGLGAEDVHATHTRQDADPLAHLGAPVIVELTRRDRIAGERDVQDRLVVGVGLGKGRRRRQVHREAARGL